MKKIALLIAAAVGLAATALAQPAYINYQGRLLDAAGQPLANGTYTLQFNIFDSPTDGNLVWGPILYDDATGTGHAPRAVVANGRFNVILGPHDTANRPLTNAFLGDERFVEITVNGGNPILPRQQVLSAPYALRATAAINADRLNHAPPADYFLPPGMVVPFAGPPNSIPPGWLLCDGSQISRTEHARLFAAIGISWGAGDSVSTFHLPDLRGMFLRGVSGGRFGGFADPDRDSRSASAPGGLGGNNVGSVQANAVVSHTHQYFDYRSYSDAVGGSILVEDFESGSNDGHYIRDDARTTGVNGNSSETRPNNAYVHYIIKY